jgi:hypothetical protein
MVFSTGIIVMTACRGMRGHLCYARSGLSENLLQRIEGTANHLGLFSEEYDVVWHEALGNFPQAFAHIGYVNSVVALQEARYKEFKHTTSEGYFRRGLLLADRIALNDGEPLKGIPPKDIALELKKSMNVLRGAFFDTEKGRIAYERMAHSDAYKEYREMSYTLKNMDLNELKSRQERISFWINLYNVIVIHGVVELGIRDSVKEVRNFYKRIKYQVGNMFFSPHEIEHGILRGNHRPPVSIFRAFGSGDERLKHIVEPLDPRVHFGLVCASSSCPPIGFYTAENLDNELDIACRTFLNAGGVEIDRGRNSVSLSRIFKWYSGDFGQSEEERLRFIAPYLYDEGDKDYLVENAGTLNVSYQDYDWRLNRT